MLATSGAPIIVREFTEFPIPVTLGILSLAKSNRRRLLSKHAHAHTGIKMASHATGATAAVWCEQPSIGSIQTMKTLSGWEAARCDEHQFRAKIKVST